VVFCYLVFTASCPVWQDTGGSSGAQLESQLLIRHVTADSFRTFTIVAENEVSTALRDIRLLTRGSCTMHNVICSYVLVKHQISVTSL